MKTLIYILFFLIPYFGNAQQNWYKSSPLDYMWKNVGNAGLTGGRVITVSLAFSPSDGQPYIAFDDYENSYKATVMKYDGNNWVNVGIAGFSTGAVGLISLAFNPIDSLPYLAFSDLGDSCRRATVMKFDGTNWIYIGNADFSVCESYYISIAFSPSDGRPYVAFQDGGNSYKASVMKFNGTSWVNVGIAGFSTHQVENTSLAFNSSDSLPYVAFADIVDYYEKASVMKFNGTNWVYVGNEGFSANYVNYTCLAMSPIGEPYVAFRDWANSYKCTVMKYDGTNWVNVGNPGFSIKEVFELSIKFSPTGQLYVAYSDWGVFFKAVVLKFDGTNWVTVGSAGFSAGRIYSTSLATSASGEPYVAFEDSANNCKATVMNYDSVYVGINKLQNSKLLLYPNPTSKSITIDVKSLPDIKYIKIEDLKGIRMFETQTCERKVVLGIENYPTGIYLVKVKSESSTWIGKFCKD